MSGLRNKTVKVLLSHLLPGGGSSLWSFVLVPLLFMAFSVRVAYGQKEIRLIREGNKHYENGKFKEAEMNYRKAIDANKSSAAGIFNLGDAVYQQKNYNESSKIFGNLAETKLPAPEKAQVFHNLGNSLLGAKDYEKSILAYENALLNNPADRDTKYNLEYARQMLKKQQQQQQQQQKKDQQNKDKKDNKKDEQNKDQKQDKKNQQDQPKKISKEDAQRMLEAMKNDEKKTLQKLKKEKAKVQPVLIEKDW
jgi:Ca-activated chloride channel homolog